MRTLGLTGGIGSGKSTAAGLLAARGASIVDADALSRATTAAGGPAIPAIAQAFGPDFISADGALDRERMRRLVFEQPAARHRLEAIVHPLVRAATDAAADEARRAGAALLVFDVPLLVESGHWSDRVDRVLVIDCEVATQLARVLARSALDEATVRRIVASQASRIERRRAADFVVFNDGLDITQLDVALGAIARSMGL
ncbi:dephospho-CoA kinase [Xylophilus rhododendri]|uniref:Dephospho-CoA kinase n=1 Tax=Xylophilus rhododendri TaxID=2697032 RepID=A0A857J300_9BURK|nr:dephospho-CoA kinase [Xylophilus rhododendri]QHI98146.1 dephospho-CoA kinase [Xylophilus rhododendri]